MQYSEILTTSKTHKMATLMNPSCSAPLNPADVQPTESRTAGNIGISENISTSRKYHAWQPGYEQSAENTKYYTGLNELLAPPAIKLDDAVIINEDRFKTSSTSVHAGRQPDKFIPREQKAPGHWKVNYVDAKQYDFSVRQEERPMRSVTGFEFRDPRSRTSFPSYVSPEVTDKSKGMRLQKI